MQSAPSAHRHGRHEVPARWSLMHHVPHVFPGLPEKRVVHPDDLPDGGIGDIQYILSGDCPEIGGITPLRQ